jgi:hypothetical protein
VNRLYDGISFREPKSLPSTLDQFGVTFAPQVVQHTCHSHSFSHSDYSNKMLTYSVLPTPKKYSERSKSVTFSDKTTTTCCDDDERKEQLKQADDHVRDSYDLLWNQEKYEDAIHSLTKALQIQQQYLGKQDKEGKPTKLCMSILSMLDTK